MEKSNKKKSASFRDFRKLCALIANCQHLDEKQQEFHRFFQSEQFLNEPDLWLRCLIPNAVHYPPPMEDFQLIQLFAEVLSTSAEDLGHIQHVDVVDALTAQFEKSILHATAAKSQLSLRDVDSTLIIMKSMNNKQDQVRLIKKLLPRFTSNDLKIFVYLLKHNLLLDVDVKSILDSLNNQAYIVYEENGHDVNDIVAKYITKSTEKHQEKKWSLEEIRNLIPVIFTGMKFLLDDSIADMERIRRFIIAYNGEIVTQFQGDTHVYYITNVARDSLRIHNIREQWIWDCIRSRSKLPFESYLLNSS